MSKKTVCLIYGGKSAEHAVSLRSGATIAAAIDESKYDLVLVGIDPKGNWRCTSLDRSKGSLIKNGSLLIPDDAPLVVLARDTAQAGSGAVLLELDSRNVHPLDVVFPIIHGTYGEDGTLQGLLEMVEVPYVGCGVGSSANCMDKAITKRLLNQAGVPTTPYLTLEHGQAMTFTAVVPHCPPPLFVKPARSGSSVGVSKVVDARSLSEAIELAYRYDTKILIEAGVAGREIECAVLGNEQPQVSLPGEIVPGQDFYTYAAKYDERSDTQLIMPAPLTDRQVALVQQTALQAYQVLGCEGMARVDLFLTADGTVLINELNTIPGFTSASMYPKLWELSGLPLPRLIDQLIDLAFARQREKVGLQTSMTHD